MFSPSKRIKKVKGWAILWKKESLGVYDPKLTVETRWRNAQWMKSNDYVEAIIPCTITYELPLPYKKKRT